MGSPPPTRFHLVGQLTIHFLASSFYTLILRNIFLRHLGPGTGISTTLIVLKNVTLTITNGLILYWKICANFLHVKSKVREKRWVIMNQSRDNNNNILEISSTGLSLFWPGQKRICNLALSLSHLFDWLSYEVVSKSLSSVTCTMPIAHSWSHSNGIKVSRRT